MVPSLTWRGWALASRGPGHLLDVARVVSVEVLGKSQVVGKELARNDRGERGEPLRRLRQAKRDVRIAEGRGGIRRDNESGAGLAQSYQHRLHLGQRRAIGDDCVYHEAWVDDRDRAVLEVRGRVGVGEDVGRLLQLERPLEGGRVVEATPEHHGALDASLLASGRLDGLL